MRVSDYFAPQIALHFHLYLRLHFPTKLTHRTRKKRISIFSGHRGYAVSMLCLCSLYPQNIVQALCSDGTKFTLLGNKWILPTKWEQLYCNSFAACGSRVSLADFSVCYVPEKMSGGTADFDLVKITWPVDVDKANSKGFELLRQFLWLWGSETSPTLNSDNVSLHYALILAMLG